jgi:hypothetical protein
MHTARCSKTCVRNTPRGTQSVLLCAAQKPTSNDTNSRKPSSRNHANATYSRKLTTRNADSTYILKRAFNHLSIRSTLNADERDTIHSDNLGMATRITKFITTRNKLANVELQTRLGAQKDQIKVTLAGLSVEAARELVISPRPGLAAVDFLSAGEGTAAQVTIESTINDVTITRAYDVPLEGGVRIHV